MLGLYNYIANSKAVQSIVRGGLQLFYKADRTQAPLGEEQVLNNSFDELGSDIIDNGNFETGIDGWSGVSGSDVTYNSELKGIKLTLGASGATKAINVNSRYYTGGNL